MQKKSNEREQRIKEDMKHLKTKSKLADINSTRSITSNANGSNNTIKREIIRLYKNKIQLYAVLGTLQILKYKQIESKGIDKDMSHKQKT